MFIENIIGTESKVKIIRTLLEINTGFTLTDLEKETGLSRGIIHKEVKRLLQLHVIIEVQKQGKLTFYKINLENQYVQILAKLFDLEKLQERKNKTPLPTWNFLSLITNKLLTKNLPIKHIVLYGSTARGTSTIHSDIDLLIITQDGFKKREIIQKVINEERKKKDATNTETLKIKTKITRK